MDWWDPKQTGEEWKTLKGNQQTLYAAWPLQAFIRGCRTSAGIKITYTRDKNWEPNNWLEGNESLQSSAYTQSSQMVTITRDVSLKIVGGFQIVPLVYEGCSDPHFVCGWGEE